MKISISEFKEIGRMAAEESKNPDWSRVKVICPKCGETFRFQANVPFGETWAYECICSRCNENFIVSVHAKVCI